MSTYTAHVQVTFKIEANTKEEALEQVGDLLEHAIQEELEKIVTLVENT